MTRRDKEDCQKQHGTEHQRRRWSKDAGHSWGTIDRLANDRAAWRKLLANPNAKIFSFFSVCFIYLF